jgi:hypothetical protein
MLFIDEAKLGLLVSHDGDHCYDMQKLLSLIFLPSNYLIFNFVFILLLGFIATTAPIGICQLPINKGAVTQWQVKKVPIM